MAGKRDEAKHWPKRGTGSLKAAEALIAQKPLDDAMTRAYDDMFCAAKPF